MLDFLLANAPKCYSANGFRVIIITDKYFNDLSYFFVSTDYVDCFTLLAKLYGFLFFLLRPCMGRFCFYFYSRGRPCLKVDGENVMMPL